MNKIRARKIIRKTRKFIGALIILAGVITIIGTAGSSDLDMLTIRQIINMILLGLSMILVGSALRAK